MTLNKLGSPQFLYRMNRSTSILAVRYKQHIQCLVSEILARSHVLHLVMANSEPVSEATAAIGAFIPVNG